MSHDKKSFLRNKLSDDYLAFPPENPYEETTANEHIRQSGCHERLVCLQK